nr:hypothetical protein CFP56_59208 [Quercus suber]
MAEMRSNAFPLPEPEPQLAAPLQRQERPSTSAAPSSSSLGLTVEVNEEGKMSVVWNSYKGDLRTSIWVKRNQKEHILSLPGGSRVHTNPVEYKGSLRKSRWVRLREHVVGPPSGSRVHLLPVVGSDSEWASRERSIKLPTVGLSMKSKLAHLDSGSTQLTKANFSSPSSHEMGESSETMAEASSDEPKPPMLTGEVADRQAVPPMVVQSSCVSGTSSDSLTVGRTEAVYSFLDGFNSDGLEVPQMVAGNGSLCLRVAPIELGCSLSDGFSSDGHTGTQMVLGCEGVSSGDSVMPQGRADGVATSFSMGFFLAAALHRMLGAGLVDYGIHGVVNAGRGSRVHLSQGVDDKCTRQIVVTETDQAKLALIESKSVFGISDLGGSMEEGGAISEVACLGEEESWTDCNPISTIVPPGLDLSMEMHKDNEVLGLGSRLDVSSWVKVVSLWKGL